jgi:hypothetical protein
MNDHAAIDATTSYMHQKNYILTEIIRYTATYPVNPITFCIRASQQSQPVDLYSTPAIRNNANLQIHARSQITLALLICENPLSPMHCSIVSVLDSSSPNTSTASSFLKTAAGKAATPTSSVSPFGGDHLVEILHSFRWRNCLTISPRAERTAPFQRVGGDHALESSLAPKARPATIPVARRRRQAANASGGAGVFAEVHRRIHLEKRCAPCSPRFTGCRRELEIALTRPRSSPASRAFSKNLILWTGSRHGERAVKCKL